MLGVLFLLCSYSNNIHPWESFFIFIWIDVRLLHKDFDSTKLIETKMLAWSFKHGSKRNTTVHSSFSKKFEEDFLKTYIAYWWRGCHSQHTCTAAVGRSFNFVSGWLKCSCWRASGGFFSTCTQSTSRIVCLCAEAEPAFKCWKSREWKRVLTHAAKYSSSLISWSLTSHKRFPFRLQCLLQSRLR